MLVYPYVEVLARSLMKGVIDLFSHQRSWPRCPVAFVLGIPLHRVEEELAPEVLLKVASRSGSDVQTQVEILAFLLQT